MKIELINTSFEVYIIDLITIEIDTIKVVFYLSNKKTRLEEIRKLHVPQMMLFALFLLHTTLIK